MNNKGFMMAEVIVVSTIILTFLVGLYLSYNKLFSLYNTRINYYDVNTLYELAYYRDIMIKENTLNEVLTSALESKVYDIFNVESKVNDNDSVFLVYNQKEKIVVTDFSSVNINPTFSDYIDYLSTSMDFNSNYIMVMERCIDIDNCKYAYLEVYDGYENE